MIESKNGKKDSDKGDAAKGGSAKEGSAKEGSAKEGSAKKDSAKEVLESLRKRKEEQKVKKLEILRLSRDIEKQNQSTLE